MNRFTSAVEKAIEDRNWYAALFISLSLPDICARLESSDDKTNGMKYAAWFDRYLSSVYSAEMPFGKHVFMSGDDCYVLRCSMLHQGLSDVSHQKKKGVLDKFYFSSTGHHMNQVESVLQLNVARFCQDIIGGVNDWYEDFINSHPDKVPKLNGLVTVHDKPFDVGYVHFGQDDLAAFRP
ncbi:hypothetical protein JIQ88_10290 [Pseudomonas sp. PCH44]|uniref:hypothetical protein n=1 Tax=Pseudomonas sp. PCH44 TaxID=2800904 RepID=UPI001BAF6096|nr:hypothetical protein [Pseudomonas sp. PCH44]MBS3185398.1 hypothetical protein [Pseudomonas sp. PCH44]